MEGTQTIVYAKELKRAIVNSTCYLTTFFFALITVARFGSPDLHFLTFPLVLYFWIYIPLYLALKRPVAFSPFGLCLVLFFAILICGTSLITKTGGVFILFLYFFLYKFARFILALFSRKPRIGQSRTRDIIWYGVTGFPTIWYFGKEVSVFLPSIKAGLLGAKTWTNIFLNSNPDFFIFISFVLGIAGSIALHDFVCGRTNRLFLLFKGPQKPSRLFRPIKMDLG